VDPRFSAKKKDGPAELFGGRGDDNFFESRPPFFCKKFSIIDENFLTPF